MDLSAQLARCKCYSAVQSTFDLLPINQPAVYAFYEAIKIRGDKLADEVDNLAVKSAKSIALSLDHLPDEIHLKFRGTTERFKGKGKRYLDGIADGEKEAFRNSLLFLSILNEPMYVGETEDVRNRFKAHHDTGFIFRMKQKTRPPDDFIFLYYSVTGDSHRALETVLIHLMSPCGNKTGSLIK